MTASLLILALMQPVLKRSGDWISAVYLMDVSESVSPSAIQNALQWIEQTNVWRFMGKLGFTDREDFLRYSHENLDVFWDNMVREARIDWLFGWWELIDAWIEENRTVPPA